MKISKSGFTIVELLIVIVVIAILAAISVVAYNGVQKRAHDAHRVADVDAVKKFLEMYRIENGHYIRSDHFLDGNAAAALATGTLKKLPPEALKGPSAGNSTISSWGQWAGNVVNDGYDYAIKSFTNTGANCTEGSGSADSDCTRYEIYYKTEYNQSYKKIDSLGGQ
jgi:prepilin-type N-terminal cleavage/methylation domain-containing protein